MFEDVVEHGYDGSDVTKVRGKNNINTHFCLRLEHANESMVWGFLWHNYKNFKKTFELC